MSQKMMTKEVTKTTVKLARIITENGELKAITLPETILIGNKSAEQAQKEVQKQFDYPITVTDVQADTTVYELPVAKFLEIASVKVPKEEMQKTLSK